MCNLMDSHPKDAIKSCGATLIDGLMAVVQTVVVSCGCYPAVALNCFAQHQNNFPETVKTLLPVSSEVLRIKMFPDMILLRCDAPKMGPWFF